MTTSSSSEHTHAAVQLEMDKLSKRILEMILEDEEVNKVSHVLACKDLNIPTDAIIGSGLYDDDAPITNQYFLRQSMYIKAAVTAALYKLTYPIVPNVQNVQQQ